MVSIYHEYMPQVGRYTFHTFQLMSSFFLLNKSVSETAQSAPKCSIAICFVYSLDATTVVFR